MSEKAHEWELAGVGKAPFTVKGVAELPDPSLAEYNPAGYQNALAMLPRGYGLGTCYVCGRPLKINFLIQDADGKKFVVGSECVKKSGDAGMVKKMDYFRRKRNRELAAARREKQRLAELQAQRDRNGGLTDYELREKQGAEQQAAREAALQPAKDILIPYADRLRDGRGGFRDSVAKTLEKGELPYGSGYSITIEILAKQEGRRGSKAYLAEEAEIEDAFEKAREIIEKVNA